MLATVEVRCWQKGTTSVDSSYSMCEPGALGAGQRFCFIQLKRHNARRRRANAMLHRSGSLVVLRFVAMVGHFFAALVFTFSRVRRARSI